MTNTVLILGGSGRFGRHATTAFRYHGWDVRQFDRKRESLWDAAWGADVIVNAWNPPYTRWDTDVPRLTAEVIEVAKASGATVIIPGNVYVYGPDVPGPWGENSHHNARNPLGRIRINMEDAHRAAGVQTIILRAGDFIDTEASGNWFDQIITARLGRGRVTYPGRPDVPHAWAWLPDLAEAAVLLAEMREGLEAFEDVPFPGYTLTGAELAAAISAAVKREARLKRMNWLPLQLMRPVWPMGRKLVEMRYLWDVPHSIDGRKFERLLPFFQPTDLDEALRIALKNQVHPDQPVPARAVPLGT